MLDNFEFWTTSTYETIFFNMSDLCMVDTFRIRPILKLLVFKRGSNESSQKLKNIYIILITQHHVNQAGGFLKRWSEKLHQLVLFFITRSFQFVQSCNVGPTPAHNLLQTQQNHNLALIIMFTTTKYCKIISSFMLFCKILSGPHFPV